MSGSSKNEQYFEAVKKTVDKAKKAEIIHLNTEDEVFNGRTITVKGQELVNFSSCSYLGLELDPRLKAAAKDAVDRYGTQFSSSRSYVSHGMYEELEQLLGTIFKKPVVLAPTTTLGHLSMIPVLVGDNDVVILDHQVHASVNMAAQMVKARGIKVEMIRHNNMDMLEQRINKLKDQYDKIWYLADGIYSMFGDGAPMEELKRLHDKYEQLQLYIDDAHGVSWHGAQGRGYVLEQLGGQWPERMYLTGSMAKSFGCVGGILVFPNEEAKQMVRGWGGTLIFSGPIQPPLLAAALASVRIHLSAELPALQARLKRRIMAFENTAKSLGLETTGTNLTPIRFIKLGNYELGFKIAEEVRNAGFYLNLAAFPSVPMKETGLRFTIHNHLTEQDITNVLMAVKAAWLKHAEELTLSIPRSLQVNTSRIAV